MRMKIGLSNPAYNKRIFYGANEEAVVHEFDKFFFQSYYFIWLRTYNFCEMFHCTRKVVFMKFGSQYHTS